MRVLKDLLLAIVTVLTPVKPAAITVAILIIVDFILGILAASKRKEKITSAGLRRTVTKLFVFELVLILGFLTETYLTGDLFPLVKIVSAFVGLVELKSIMENLNEINGDPILAALITKLGSENDKQL